MGNKAGSGRYQNGAARRKCKARHIAAEGPIPICPLCGKPIDLTLKTPHPLSCELDEIIPYSRGGSPTSYDNTQLYTQNLQPKEKRQNNQHHRPPKHKKTTTKHHPNQPPMVTGAIPSPSHARLPAEHSARIPPQPAWSIVRLAAGVSASARGSRSGMVLMFLPRCFPRLLRLILRSFDMSRN